jgi:hypothetical protein
MTNLIFDAEVFQNLFDSVDNLLFIVDDGGSIINDDAAAHRILGYKDNPRLKIKNSSRVGAKYS